jgi:hypothetical protein
MDMETIRAKGTPPYTSSCLLFTTLPGQVENESFIFIKMSALMLPSIQTRGDNGMEVQSDPEIS